jgi:hypothetical protein
VALEYVVYADESDESGPYYANFYGGLLVRSPDLAKVQAHLQATKEDLRLSGKTKWQKVTAQYLKKYLAFVNAFFDLVERDLIKVRIMFQHRVNVAVGLQEEQKANTYYLLYYQFLKHAFGLQHSALERSQPVSLRFYLDQRGGTLERKAQFKGFLAALERQPDFKEARILVPIDQIAEVSINEHVLLQCVDIVLGAVQFRLNDRHKVKPEGKTKRADRTIAKEKLYKAILARIQAMHPHFNIGISTGVNGDITNRWKQRYRHWEFQPTNSRIDPTKVKPK